MKKILYNNQNINYKYNYINFNSPTTVFIKITSKCMLNCNFCSQGKSKNSEIDIVYAKKLLVMLKKHGVLRIFYTGGEPFLYSKFNELLEYGEKLGLCQLVITNGFLLIDEKYNSCLKHINGISISIHGTEKKHNIIVNNKFSHKKAVEGIKFIKQNYPKIALDICYTATPENTTYDDIYYVAKLCQKYEMSLNITRMYNIGKAIDLINDFSYINDLTKILKKIKDDGYSFNIGHCLAQCNQKTNIKSTFCMAGIDFCFIDINGNVKICGNSIDSIGNIHKTRFKKIWNRNQRKLNKRIKNLPLLCKNCENMNTCFGGCKTENNNKKIGLNDLLAISKINSLWEIIKYKKTHLEIATIKRIGLNRYLIIGRNSSVVNSNAIRLLNKFVSELTLEENLRMLKKIYDKNQIINLFILLWKDKFLVENN